MPTADPAPAACCSVPPTVPSVAEFGAMPAAELIARYKRGVENYDRRVFWLNESQLDTAFLPDAGVGRWPVRVLLGHLADSEIAFVHRMRKIAAEESPMLASFDEDAFIDADLYGHMPHAPAPTPEADASRVNAALGGFIAVVHTLRQWTAAWLATLPEPAFARTGMHTVRGPQTLKDVLAYDAWHLEHHARFLRLKLDRMMGEAEMRTRAAEQTGGGGCGAGCGCMRRA